MTSLTFLFGIIIIALHWNFSVGKAVDTEKVEGENAIYCNNDGNNKYIKINIKKIEGDCKLNSKTKFNNVKLLGGTYDENADTIKWESTNNLSKEFTKLYPDPNLKIPNIGFPGPVIDVPLIINRSVITYYSSYYEHQKFKIRTSKKCTFYAYFDGEMSTVYSIPN
ncbi:hypothetical protein PIROE2DRAFT_12828 [Piromyces sp. E2]|nr:hypothetical protein PIROE2DRAFT_12828 [Piromyces sp. E2]|eukprot:OUM61242.1 hypothetical protein PIROE2DRAFT_12828 [Piromyces sp. E2]